MEYIGEFKIWDIHQQAWDTYHVWITLDELDGSVSTICTSESAQYTSADSEIPLAIARAQYPAALIMAIEERVAKEVEWSHGAEESG